MLGPNIALHVGKSQPTVRLWCGIFISCFYSLSPRPSDSAPFSGSCSTPPSSDPRGQQARRRSMHMQTNGYRGTRSGLYDRSEWCRSVLCQTGRIFIHSFPEKSRRARLTMEKGLRNTLFRAFARGTPKSVAKWRARLVLLCRASSYVKNVGSSDVSSVKIRPV